MTPCSLSRCTTWYGTLSEFIYYSTVFNKKRMKALIQSCGQKHYKVRVLTLNVSYLDEI